MIGAVKYLNLLINSHQKKKNPKLQILPDKGKKIPNKLISTCIPA